VNPTDLSDLFESVSLQDSETMAHQARCFALVPCAGSGSRAGTVMPKQYELIAGQSMVMHTLAALQSVDRLEKTVVVVSPTDSHVWPESTVQRIQCGGATRAESVFNGLTQLLADGVKNSEGVQSDDWILVHDAARCLITDFEIAIARYFKSFSQWPRERNIAASRQMVGANAANVQGRAIARSLSRQGR
jgi:2-C-methyl-D-erythritol 4-phosphate cytidylyltransferase